MNSNWGYLIGALIAITGVVGYACGSDAEADVDETIQARTVQHNGYTYNCLKYTTVDRGGLWCDRISTP